jgi:hypothetical protein
LYPFLGIKDRGRFILCASPLKPLGFFYFFLGLKTEEIHKISAKADDVVSGSSV